MNLLLDSSTIGWAIIGMTVLIGSLIFWFRIKFSKISEEKQFSKNNTTILSRNKYTEVNAFKWSNTFLKVGMVMSLAFVVLAFNWTTFERTPTEGITIELDEEIEMDMPITFDLPKPPPPLPPPVKIEVPDEPVEDEPPFIDQSIDEKAEVVAPSPPKPTIITPPKPTLLPSPDPDGGNTIKFFAEQMPRFPGCNDLSGDKKDKDNCAQKKLLQFLSKNINYPALARENGIQGTVVIRFVVEKNGNLSSLEIIRDPGGGLGKEALRVVNMMNQMSQKWSPGKQNARPVRVQFNLPVRFRLQ